MGKFTVYDNQWIDEQIQAQLDVIVKNITAALPDLDISIVLSGGFGRGEGSIIKSEGGVVTPLKDYDIWILADQKVPASKCRLIQNRVYEELGFLNPEGEKFQFSKFVIDIESTTINNLNLYPDIFSYELKKASTLLYGKDVRVQIAWTSQDVSLASGLRLLFQKFVGLIGHFREEYLSGSIDSAARLQLSYECYKTYVEIATSLCILMGCYEPSFALRARLFREHFKERLIDLYLEVPQLSELVTKGTNFKLKPDLTYLEVDPVLLWDHTRNVLGRVLKFYLNSCLEIANDDWINLPKQASRKMSYLYYRPIADAFTNAKLGTTNHVLSAILIALYQRRLSYAYARKMKEVTNTFYWRSLLQSCSPTMTVYLTSPLVLYSLQATGAVDKSYSEAARKHLRGLIPTQRIGDGSHWDDLRNAYLLAYRLTGLT